MRIYAYIKSKSTPDSVFKEIEPAELLRGKNIDYAVNHKGINKANFNVGFIQMQDSGIKLDFRFDDYSAFINRLWALRVKLKKAGVKA